MAPTVRLRPDLALAPLLLTLTATLALALWAPRVDAGVTQRSFRFSPADLSTESADDGAIVRFRGAVPSEVAGAPEVPVVPAFVALPPGERVVRVDVEASGWTAAGNPVGRIRPAGAVSSGLPRVASTPAAEFYGDDAWYPRVAGVRGAAGQLRGRNLAGVALHPVRVAPQSGRIEVASEIVVTVVTEPDPNAFQDARRRVVPEWDREFFEVYEGLALGLDAQETRENLASDAKIQHVSELSSAPGQGFAPTGVPSVEGSPVQYLIVTSNAMAGELQRLADWRTKTGMPTIVRTIEFITANYNYGFDKQDRVRRFIKDAYLQWGITHVLIGGDTDILPVRYGRTRFYNGNYLPTDLYYSDLDGNWNADGDSLFGEAYEDSIQQGDNINMFPDVYVGRAPIVTLAQAQTFVNKVLQYSKTPLGNYENRILLAGEVLFPQNWEYPDPISLDGAADCEAAISHLGPEMAPVRLYENYTDYDTVGALPESAEAVLDSLNNGWGFFHHVGHGFRNTMSCGNDAMTNADVDLLTNGNKTWVMYAINCTSVAVDFASIGEAFILNPNGGAVANIGATREDFPVTSRSYLDEYYSLIFTSKVATIGEAFAKQKVPFVGLAFYDNTHRWTQYVLNMLGDPAMPVWWRKPLTMSVTHPANVSLGDTTFTITVNQGGPVDSARVCLMKGGEEYEVVLTNASGQATLHVRPETAGAASLVVTKKGNKPFEGTVNFTATGSPMLVQRAVDRLVDDDTAGGTNGSSDAGADAGEIIDWRLPVRNIGGSATLVGVTGTLSSTDPRVTITTPSSSYGTIAAAAVSNGTPYRITIQNTISDGAEPLFKLDLVAGSNHWVDEFRLPVKAPTMALVGTTVIDNGTNGTIGNSNGRLDIGELVDFTVTLRNVSTGIARNLTATLSTSSANITIQNPAATIGNVAWNTTATSTAFRILNSGNANPKFTLTVSDPYGVRFTRELDVLQPVSVVGLVGTGSASSITLVWKKSGSGDLAGYNVYRASNVGGPYTKVNTVPTDRTAVYVDEALPPLTAFYYRIAAVDSSGNESSTSTSASASTNPPLHAGFPLPTEHTMSSALAIGNIDNSNDSSIEIVAGSNVLYMWHADGSPVIDADGTERTPGDFTIYGSYYAPGATIADLDLNGTWEIIAPTWDSKELYVYESDGQFQPGFPISLSSSVWSSAAVGNIDADPNPEIVFSSNDNKVFAFNWDGSEVLDGDADPLTTGVFKVLSQSFNYSSPALADLDGDGRLDIILGGFDGFLYAWKNTGANIPGWPVNLFAGTTSSPAVGDIDNDGQLEIAITATNNRLFVYNQNGTAQAGFPINGVGASGVSRLPSPIFADMEGNGQKCVVINTTDGFLRVYRNNGTLVPAWASVRYTNAVSGASESSPIAADIDGDGQNEILVGGEDANLSAFDNNGTLMAGFPIKLNGEVRGSPVAWDIDHDQLTEILIAGWDKNVYVWDYPGTFCPTGPPAWAMWRHDQFRTGRLTSPIVVAVGGVAFSAQSRAASGVELSFALPSSGDGDGLFDVFRSAGPGPTGDIVYAMPDGFERMTREPLAGTAGSLLSWSDVTALPGQTYRYLLVKRMTQPGDTFLAFGPFAAEVTAEAPAVAYLAQSYPNPAPAGRPSAIAYGIPGDGAALKHVVVRLYDVKGRVVRTLVNESVPPGRYQATWDGKDDHGVRVTPGMYFYELAAGADRLTKKALVIAP